jgi:hypothetical protein
MYTLWTYEVGAPLAAAWALAKMLCCWGSENCLTWRILSSPSSSVRERIQAASDLYVVSWAEHMDEFCVMGSVTVWDDVTVLNRRTNVEDDPSWGFNYFVNMELGVADISFASLKVAPQC